ncbi:PAX3- and PAX7-binding protein 1-like [Myotis daubentonii]|uniref:PAX3- and PAX7-binding protein 1-like n=1 Tax=Myotis daubentonii TaxID=98922 RepID=UPI002873AB3D|nr:PAX3- and PAX7-binding protein 1-like [Myotis daubentonii]
MFRKARRVNVRKRNDSEEEERERDEEQELPPLLPPPGTGEEPGDRAPGGEVPPGPGPPPPPALTPSHGAEAGACCPGGADPGNGLKARQRPRENREVPRTSLLSFQDEEEENEEVFKVKKSSYSKKIVTLLKKEYKEDREKSKVKTELNSSADNEPPLDKTGHVQDPGREDGAAVGGRGEDEMDMESEREEEKPKAGGGAFANALSPLNVLRPGEIPDAAFIHAARKKRQMARELGDFAPHDSEPGKGRLVREDENDASDDEDDDEKRRIVFSVKEKSQRQKIAEEIGIEGSDDDAFVAGGQDEELSGWEQEQIRKGINIPQVQASQPAEVNRYYPNTYPTMPYGSSYGLPYSYTAYGSSDGKSQKTDNSAPFKTPSNEMTPVTIDLVKKQLKDRLDSMKDVHRANRQQHEKHLQSRVDSARAIERLEGASGGTGERYKFLQEMRGYVQDLLECFSEKVPLMNELESAIHRLYTQRASRLVQRRQDDIEDESSEFSSHSNKAPMAPNLDSFGRDRALYQEHAKRRIAEREARRTRRRQAREQTGKMADHLEGLSSDDEETSTDITNFNLEKDRISKESRKVFEDVLENFCSIDCIKSQFEAWRSRYYTSYKDAYIGLCLPKLFNPLIRLQLLTWTPLEAKCRDFENMLWFESLLFYGCEEREQEREDVDIALLPTMVEKVILPKLTVIAENMWDPFSTTQTSRMVGITLKLVNGYPSVANAENKNTQVYLKALLLRMRRTLDDDVFMPLYPKNVLENKNSGPYLFFQRQFWSSVKLLGNFLQWYGIFSNKTLQELPIDGLLNRYILMAFQNSEYGDDSIKKAQNVINCFPKQWFMNLKGERTISQLENFCRYLVHLADTIYRNSIGCSDVEKRNARENIKQIIKLLASVHALDHAVAVAGEHNVKEFKSLVEGKAT